MTKSTVDLSEYNPNWVRQFEYEKERILNVLGERVVGIEHIGSTSIKGIVAKPVIDIIVGIRDLAECNFVSLLGEIEYEYVPKPEFTDRRFFRKGLWGQGTCHLHICEFNGNEWIEKLLFRDYLRLHTQVAEEYALLKKELALTYQHDRTTYTNKKGPFIKKTIEKAMKELHIK